MRNAGSFSRCHTWGHHLSVQLHHLHLGLKTIPGSSSGQGLAPGSPGRSASQHWLSGISQQEQSKWLTLNKTRILLRLRLDNLIRKRQEETQVSELE